MTADSAASTFDTFKQKTLKATLITKAVTEHSAAVFIFELLQKHCILSYNIYSSIYDNNKEADYGKDL